MRTKFCMVLHDQSHLVRTHHLPQSSYALKAQLPWKWKPKGCNIQGVKESNEKKPQYWNQNRSIACFLTVKEKKPTLRKLNTITPLTEREPLEWEGREGHLNSPGINMGAPHTLPSCKHGSLPPSGFHSYQWGNSQPDSRSWTQCTPQFIRPLSRSQNPWASQTFWMCKNYTQQCTYIVDANVKPKI